MICKYQDCVRQIAIQNMINDNTNPLKKNAYFSTATWTFITDTI